MSYLRNLCVISAGLGFIFGSTYSKVTAQPCEKDVEDDLLDFEESRRSQPRDEEKIAKLIQTVNRFGCPRRDKSVHYKDFEMSYDKFNGTPNWVLEHLTLDKYKPHKERLDILAKHKQYLEENTDVPLSIFDPDFLKMGHGIACLVDKKDHTDSFDVIAETYLSSTIVPRASVRENTLWNDLNSYVRYLTLCYKNVYVFSGPLYMQEPYQAPVRKHFSRDTESEQKLDYVRYEILGKNRVAVPFYFYKMIFAEKNSGCFHFAAYLVPNDEENYDDALLSDYRLTANEIQRFAGFRFFKKRLDLEAMPKIPDVPTDFRKYKKNYLVGNLSHFI